MNAVTSAKEPRQRPRKSFGEGDQQGGVVIDNSTSRHVSVSSPDRFDKLAQAFGEEETIKQAIMSHFSDELSEAGIKAAVTAIITVNKQSEVIGNAALTIGNALLDAREAMQESGYNKLYAYDLIKIGRSSGDKLMRNALAIRNGEFTQAEFPLAYSTGYLLVTQPREVQIVLREQGLVNPHVKRADLAAAIDKATATVPKADDLPTLIKERQGIERRLRKARIEVETLGNELEEMNAKITKLQRG